MNKKTLTVNASLGFGLPTFGGPSDKLVRSVNPLTQSVGVDKKHNSYDRYLARKKGKYICCCVCTQLIKTEDTGNLDLHNAQVGDIVTQITPNGATGVIISVILGTGIAGDLDQIVVRVDDCINIPFVDDSSGGSTLILTPPRGGSGVPNFTILETNTCR